MTAFQVNTNGNPFTTPKKGGSAKKNRSLGFLKISAEDNNGNDHLVADIPLSPSNTVQSKLYEARDRLDAITFRMEINPVKAEAGFGFGGVVVDMEQADVPADVLGYMNVYAVDQAGREKKVGYQRLSSKNMNHVGIFQAKEVLEDIPFKIELFDLQAHDAESVGF